MNSMTGFGRGEAQSSDVAVVVEMKSVNNRFRDVQLRLPREYMLLEPRIQDQLRQDINRGRVEVFVRRTAGEGTQHVVPDPALAESYHRAVLEIAKRLQKDDSEVALALIVAQPGVLQVVDREADALSEWAVVEAALEGALDELLSMRATEGEALRRDLHGHLDQMLLRGQIEAEAMGINERLHARLEARLERLLGDRVDPVRLAQEAAVLADKADVSEELSRIASHCQQLQDALADSSEPVGRKIDFLLQELNREVNTVGSKSSEHPISAKVVEMKSVLERMREQAANVE